MRKISIPIVALTFLLLGSCASEPQQNSAKEPAIPVQVSNAAPNSNDALVSASGTVVAAHSAQLSTRSMGYVKSLSVKVGDRVQAGQLLISIQSAELQAKMAQANAAVAQANAGFKSAEKDYQRFEQLFKTQSASQKELDDWSTRYEMAKASLEAAKQMANEVKAQFAYANITAPFNGVVTNTFVKEGDLASPGLPLLSVEGNADLQVEAMVSESDIAAIKKGMSVKVMAKSIHRDYAGKVIELSSSATNTGGQYLVKISLDQPEGVLSGMFVHVLFPIAWADKPKVANTSLLVPAAALVHQGQLVGIYTPTQDKIALLRWLKIGKQYGDQVEVLSGLSANEAYILSADGKLYNGATISF